MITEALAELLVKQVASELTAHQNYMGISIYFKRESLDGWAKLFQAQAIEEAQHAMKIVNFLVDNDIPFDLPALGASPTQYATARHAVEAAAASEHRVSTEFRTMAKVANEQGDWTGFQFLQWFIEEQTEEEAKMSKILDLIDSGINLFQAEDILEKLEG